MNCPSLVLDDEEGGFKAAQHLIELGHRCIAGFFKTDDLQGVNRLKGLFVLIITIKSRCYRNSSFIIRRRRRDTNPTKAH
ncbi:hypothetical protein QFZ80_002580 [Paenibacillus sp. V4I7]|nr:hypothetical protein [Paenibacillus sp. V4I7]MDQ0915258.1 hypothetical protein [Paenibacillus sp. V4I5]